MVNTIKSIANTIPTEEESSVLPTNDNKSVEDITPITPLPAFTITSPSHSQLSTPLSTLPESPYIASSSAIKELSESTALQLPSIILLYDNDVDDCGGTLNLRGEPNNGNISVETITGKCDKTGHDIAGSVASVRLRLRTGKLDYHEAPVRSFKLANLWPDYFNPGNVCKNRCCLLEILLILLLKLQPSCPVATAPLGAVA